MQYGTKLHPVLLISYIANDPRIVNAKRLPEVWERFSTFIKSNVGRHQKGIIIAWNGESCDMQQWIYKAHLILLYRFQTKCNTSLIPSKSYLSIGHVN